MSLILGHNSGWKTGANLRFHPNHRSSEVERWLTAAYAAWSHVSARFADRPSRNQNFTRSRNGSTATASRVAVRTSGTCTSKQSRSVRRTSAAGRRFPTGLRQGAPTSSRTTARKLCGLRIGASTESFQRSSLLDRLYARQSNPGTLPGAPAKYAAKQIGFTGTTKTTRNRLTSSGCATSTTENYTHQ